jgi:hypothetical protein
MTHKSDIIKFNLICRANLYCQNPNCLFRGGYFVGATCQSVAKINARRVIHPKSARGVLGSCDYTSYQEAATKTLLHVFASAKHLHAKNAEG